MEGHGGAKRPSADARRRRLAQRLESLSLAGVTDLPRRTGVGPRSRPAGPGRQDDREGRPEAAAGPAAAPETRERSLAVLREEVAACRRCEPLARARAHTVFGAGPATARLCFLGEAPGADEDATGQPFVGRAGQLLTKIIEACTLTRDEVYILNVLKCRPPDNRPPLAEETANCRGFFERQLEIIEPDIICCLGTTAAQALLQSEETIGKLRKRWFTWRSSQVICTYHPSYLLRNPAAKREVWDDMKLLMARFGVRL